LKKIIKITPLSPELPLAQLKEERKGPSPAAVLKIKGSS
jgi:hypothetical protein